MRQAAALLCCLAVPAGLSGQPLKPETIRDFECYVQSAEARMEAQKAFLRSDTDSAFRGQLISGKKIETVLANGPNPHKVAGGQLYDWIGAVYIPATTLERTVKMIQDYDHRAQYFAETMSSSKLLCHTGDKHFRYTMRMKEPAVIDVESDVVWERVDAAHWRCRSYSTKVEEVGKDHRYLQRLYSYWRFAAVDQGVMVEAETITLSGEFGGLTRALGSMIGISPEKSLRKSLQSMRETLMKPDLKFGDPPSGMAECAAAFRPAGCTSVTQR